MAEPRPNAEQKKDERHEGGLDRHDALALREQVNGDPGDEGSEDERDLFGEVREQQGDPPGEVGRPEEESEARAVPPRASSSATRGTNKRPQPSAEQTTAKTNLKPFKASFSKRRWRIPS